MSPAALAVEPGHILSGGLSVINQPLGGKSVQSLDCHGEVSGKFANVGAEFPYFGGPVGLHKAVLEIHVHVHVCLSSCIECTRASRKVCACMGSRHAVIGRCRSGGHVLPPWGVLLELLAFGCVSRLPLVSMWLQSL